MQGQQLMLIQTDANLEDHAGGSQGGKNPLPKRKD